MSTRKVKDAIDLETNEKVYLKGHAKATYMSDGRTVEDAINEVSSGGSTYPIINCGNEDTLSTFVLSPNTFYIWDVVGFLDLSLGEEVAGVLNEYLFQFTSDSVATTLSLPDSIIWVSELTIEANKTYQVSIVNNIGLIVGV